jgi:hypothetical protein
VLKRAREGSVVSEAETGAEDYRRVDKEGKAAAQRGGGDGGRAPGRAASAASSGSLDAATAGDEEGSEGAADGDAVVARGGDMARKLKRTRGTDDDDYEAEEEEEEQQDEEEEEDSEGYEELSDSDEERAPRKGTRTGLRARPTMDRPSRSTRPSTRAQSSRAH